MLATGKTITDVASSRARIYLQFCKKKILWFVCLSARCGYRNFLISGQPLTYKILPQGYVKPIHEAFPSSNGVIMSCPKIISITTHSVMLNDFYSTLFDYLLSQYIWQGDFAIVPLLGQDMFIPTKHLISPSLELCLCSAFFLSCFVNVLFVMFFSSLWIGNIWTFHWLISAWIAIDDNIKFQCIWTIDK